MPNYDYRCQNCGARFTLSYKTYAEHDVATPCCPQCDSAALSRLITGVTISRPSRDYTRMSEREMLSVLDSGDSRQVGTMFQQVGATAPELGDVYQETTERLLRGESIEEVEQSLPEDSSLDD